MQPTIIGETIQEFDGKRYYRSGTYFRNKEKGLLHRRVWEKNYGPIPPDYHVHHRDHDRSNNNPSNLECLDSFTHQSFRHGDRSFGRRFTAADYALAARWHASEEGRVWHKEHYEQDCARLMHAKVGRHCAHCGIEFQALARPQDRFCSNACKSAYRRASGVDDVDRVCRVCSGTFKVNKYSKQGTCSGSCGSAASGNARRGVPQSRKCV